jgi:hypothetical protein
MIRDYQVFGDVMPLVDSHYLHLWMGNNPDADGGPQKEEKMLEALAKVRGENAHALQIKVGEAKQSERYNKLAGDVLRQVQDDPATAVQRRIRAGLYFFLGEKWVHTGSGWNDEGMSSTDIPSWLQSSYPTILSATLLALLLLGVLGWRWSYAWRWESLPASLAVFWIPVPYILSHAEGLQGPRLPLDGVLLCYAALAIVCLVPGVGGRLLNRTSSDAEGDPINRAFPR